MFPAFRPPPCPAPTRQIVHDDKAGSTTVSFLEYADVSQPQRVAALLERAMRARSVGATAMNEQSSRSHMVFQLAIEGANAETGQKARGECVCGWGWGGVGSDKVVVVGGGGGGSGARGVGVRLGSCWSAGFQRQNHCPDLIPS
jgi:hypothetical protein